jgi:hypothetical protein
MLRVIARVPILWAQPAGKWRVGSFVCAWNPARLSFASDIGEVAGPSADKATGASLHLLLLRLCSRYQLCMNARLSRTRLQLHEGRAELLICPSR